MSTDNKTPSAVWAEQESAKEMQGFYKTLADVKPGGRVRLGDQAERARFEAYFNAFNLDKNADGSYLREMIQDKWEDWQVAWQAALSAQPSPGGQDAHQMADALERIATGSLSDYEGVEADELHILRCAKLIRDLAARQPVESEENVAADTYWTLAEMIEPHVQREGINPDGALPASVHDSVAILLEHWLRARQPVGEPVAWVNGRHLDECIAMPMIESNDDATVLNPRNIAASSRPDGYTDTPLYRHPAQAVDHQAALLAEERAHGETIDQRDRCEEVTDELADHIARITGVDIGEHSSANCPWQNAIEAAEEYKPAQAVGHIVVTRNESGTIVAVTRQDEEGNILQVIAE